ncbi:hypothetical protein MBRA1_001916 [Malassezia brasiliensis]|uniref:EXPERA domain-containing protein n=1 Tax=Malassezia brasiliensis TaxID=1821822 RepID=A0AAF0DT96_9BASI|nr:hypothetical protein MBRA1_001916 [Malassezia brasiliensis]
MTAVARAPAAVPLYKRYVDLVFFVYFAFHLLASALVDNYLEKSADPLIPKVWLPNYIWFRMSLFSEFVIQVPSFVLGMYALWHDDRRIYPLLVVYGAIASFTTLQCIATVIMGTERASLTDANLAFLLQYVMS